jgi:nitrate reductase gamma subunit
MSDPVDPGGYAPMTPEPFGGPDPVAPGPAPASVENAVRAMFARAALGIVGLIVLLATKSTLKERILEKNPSADAARVDTLLNSAVAIGTVVGLVFIVLYVLLALQVRKGKSWARIVTWVLAGLGVLGALASLVQPQPALSRVVSILAGLLDIAIIVLLAQRPSSEFFRRNGVPA